MGFWKKMLKERKEEELKKLRNTFKGMIIDIANDLDPTGEIVDGIRHNAYMGLNKYLEEKTDEFIEKLQD